MDLKKYRVFMTAFNLGSFAKAADELGYTPSGVTHMMNALEDELGFPLLIRGKSGVKLTDNGARLVPILLEMLRVESDFSQTVAEINGLNVGTINVASYSSIATNWLPSIIRDFNRDFPNIRIKLFEGFSQEVVSLLEDRKVDVGFMSYREDKNFDWIPLREDPMVAVLPMNHPLAKEGSYPIENCQHEPFIMPARGEDYDVIELLRKEDISPPILIETCENYSAISMIACGFGMSIMQELITMPHNGAFVKLPLCKPRQITLGIAIPNINKISPAVQKFITYAKRTFQ